MAYSTLQQFKNVFAAAASNEDLASDCLGLAADWVQSFAPEPEEPTEDYSVKAGRAERAVAAHLLNTYGGVSRKGIGNLSKSYSEGETIRALVQQSMGSYYRAKSRTIRSRPAVRG